MGLIYLTSGWSNSLWTRHVHYNPSAKDVMREGTGKQSRFLGFAQDIHSLLYLRQMPESAAMSDPPAWAEAVLEQARQLPEWAPLKARCQESGLAAGIAAEQILQAILPLLPQEEKRDKGEPGRGRGPGGIPGPGGLPGPGGSSAPSEEELRRRLRDAARKASEAVDEAEESLDGFMGCGWAGNSTATTETEHDTDTLMGAYALIRDNPKLREIGELAGRLQRLAARHKKTIVKAQEGYITGIGLGGHLPAILPSELAGVRSPLKVQRLAALAKILAKTALQYEYKKTESEGRGPVVVLMDESSSMGGVKDIWSKAVAMALLATATEQRRDFSMLGFNYNITYEESFPAGQADLRKLVRCLRRKVSGGTNFNDPLRRACDIVTEGDAALRKADIIMITDGEDAVSLPIAQRVLHLRETLGLHLYVIGLGVDARYIRREINDSYAMIWAIATQSWLVSDAPGDRDSDKIVPMLTLLDDPVA